MNALWLACILLLAAAVVCEPGGHIAELRTGHVDVRERSEQYRLKLSSTSARRLLALEHEQPCRSASWCALRSSRQALLALHDGTTAAQKQQLLEALHASGAVVTGFVPPSTWLVLGRLEALGQALDGREHVSWVPVEPQDKVAPEWEPVLHASRQPASAALLADGEHASRIARQLGHDTSDFVGRLRTHGGGGGSSPADARFLIEVHFPEVDVSDLGVLGCSSSGSSSSSGSGGYDPAAAALTDWQAPFASHVAAAVTAGNGGGGSVNGSACGVSLVVERRQLLASVCAAGLAPALDWLSHQPLVNWLSPAMHARVHNLLASIITQQGWMNGSVTDLTRATARPFWAAGLDGSGQVVGVGDSGVDMDSCYFFDDKVPFLTQLSRDADGNQVFTSSSHRKFVMYSGYEDTRDQAGHGTHVVGTLAGRKLDGGVDSATGIAPGAKVAFMDLSRDGTDAVWTPANLALNYFPRTYTAGARVHSDSWGSDSTTYDALASQVDRFTWSNQDFVSVIAAGNYGTNTGYTTTVTSPAVAKNCIAASASPNYRSSYQSTTSYSVYRMAVRTWVAGDTVNVVEFKAMQAAFGGGMAALQSDSRDLVASSPETACSGIVSTAARGAVLLVRRGGGCSFSTKARNAQAAGAIGLVITNDRAEGYFEMAADRSVPSAELTIPVLGVPLSVGNKLWALAQPSRRPTVRFAPQAPSTISYDDVASYSSFGPTRDRRIKPDIIAPGSLTSAASDRILSGTIDTCAKMQMSGTSMATPVVAASAAIARQYFLDGFYPTGAPAAGNPRFSPSGPLIKAVLLGGAAAMQGNVPGTLATPGLPLEAPPSYRQGFGRLDLHTALPLQGAAPAGWRLQVVNGAPLTEGKSHAYCVRSTGGPLRITLAWYDYPAALNAERALVNNLDLEVRASATGGEVVLGNGFQDDVNTVETVSFDSLAAGNVAIAVVGRSVFSRASPQLYSLVVLGRFSGALESAYNPASSSNSTSGSCAIGVATVDRQLSVAALTTNAAPAIYFASEYGFAPSDGFECRLQAGKDALGANPKLHDWRGCSSPARYSGLPDGAYIFQVRTAGEDLADSHFFTIDNTRPITNVQSSLPAPSAGASVPVTASDNVTIAFAAVDASAVTFTCSVTFANGPTPRWARAASSTSGDNGTAISLGRSFVCTPPLTLLGLSHGDWSVQVSARDAAGNVQAAANSVSWQTRYTPGLVYARVASGPVGLTNRRTLSYRLRAFTGTDGVPSDLPSPRFEYTLHRSGVAPLQSEWTAAGAALDILTADLADGQYVLRVRVQQQQQQQQQLAPAASAEEGGDTWAATLLTLDTTPPVIVVTQPPASYQTDPEVTIQYTTAPVEDEAATVQCRSMRTAPGGTFDRTAATPPFGPCLGEPGAARFNVSVDGPWLLQLRGTDAAGNVGAATDVSLFTDQAPPVVSDIRAPEATTSTRVDITFSLTDGRAGSGVANVSCNMVATYVSGPQNLTTVPGVALPTGEWNSRCTSPALYQLQEGRYVFNLHVEDRAGLKVAEARTLVMDVTPPVSKVTSAAQQPGAAFPSDLSLSFEAKDLPEGSPSGIASSQCQVAKADAAVSLPASAGAGDDEDDDVGGKNRRSRALRARTQIGQWVACTSPVALSALPTGSYTLRVRSVDKAGNAGQPSEPFSFLVNADLSIGGGGGSGGAPVFGLRSTSLIIILAAVGAVAVLSIGAGTIWYRRRQRLQYEAEEARRRQMYAVSGADMMPPGPYVGGGSGYVNGAPVDPAAWHAADEARRLRVAQERSLEEYNLRRAIEASLAESGGRPAGTAGAAAASPQRPVMAPPAAAGYSVYGSYGLNNGGIGGAAYGGPTVFGAPIVALPPGYAPPAGMPPLHTQPVSSGASTPSPTRRSRMNETFGGGLQQWAAAPPLPPPTHGHRTLEQMSEEERLQAAIELSLIETSQSQQQSQQPK